MVALARVAGLLQRGADLTHIFGRRFARPGVEGGEHVATDGRLAPAVGDVEVGLIDPGDAQVRRQQHIGIGRGVERARQIDRQAA
jgi:hypothetical protein